MEIPWRELDDETLDRLLSELVTRDGTDYGLREQTTAEKVKGARRALESGRAQLMWNAEVESASLVSAEQVREEQRAYQKDAEAAGLTSAGENKQVAETTDNTHE